MFDKGDEAYLRRMIARNEVILFLGAGFSVGATNRSGQHIPLADATARGLWSLIYDAAYEQTSLPDIYDAVLQGGVPRERIRTFLENNFLTEEIPPQYDVITKIFWYRIYTTNIDDLLRRVYHRNAGPRLQVLSYLKDEPKERNAALDSIQAVYLHGSLPCNPEEVVFSTRQYARSANEVLPLYLQFVGDYATHPTVFIGTELNEPLLWQYIEARERRAPDVTEQRPKSFLITPHIPLPKRTQLRSLNVVPIEAKTEDFLAWLLGITGQLPTREEVLRVTLPSVMVLRDSVSAPPDQTDALTEFGEAFHLVPSSLAVSGDRSFYLLGATPRWEDIFRGLDAPRAITDDLLGYVARAIESAAVPRVVAVLGSAGSGKSTILRRLGVRLAQSGYTPFLTNAEELPRKEVIVTAVEALDKPAILLFDNAEIVLTALADLVDATTHLKYPPVFVIASRINEFDRRSARLEKVSEIRDFEVPSLSRAEIIEIIRRLDDHGFLGKLQGMKPSQRVREFEHKADRQILVAMREATSGEGFDEIIKNEFAKLPGPEARLLYLCVALATDAGYRLTRQQFVNCASASPSEALYLLERSLRGIVIHTGPRKDLLLLRHRLIAEFMLDQAAPRPLLGDAYVRLLKVLAGEAMGSGPRSRTFGLYRELVNHNKIYERFSSRLEDARAIYESIAGALRSEAHFWLQFGLLELEFGNLQLAENYLRQGESLFPDSNLIQNSIGHLYLRKAVEADSLSAADQFRRDGSEILLAQMETYDSPYPYHIYCSQRLNWARKWLRKREELRKELEHLREIVRDGKRDYPRNRRLQRLSDDLDYEYMALAAR